MYYSNDATDNPNKRTFSLQPGRLRLLTISALAIALSACASSGGPGDEEALIQAGAQRLSGAQVEAHVTGMTESWLHGGAYYEADGKIKVKWRKAILRGSWDVAADGRLCYQLPRWERRCHFYMDKAGAILLLDEGENIGARQMYQGDKLAALGRYSTGSDRKR